MYVIIIILILPFTFCYLIASVIIVRFLSYLLLVLSNRLLYYFCGSVFNYCM